jgi:uncharacterized protein YjbK
MSIHLEIESKILVTGDEYDLLLKKLNLGENLKVYQTNYYIDTLENHLRTYGFGLRIRELNNSFTLTLKSPMAEGVLEKNQVLTAIEYKNFKEHHLFPKGLVKDFLDIVEFDTSLLKIITSLTTERIDTTFENRHICLDKNMYNGHVDYEVESEESSLQLASETLKKLCEYAGITYVENKISKHSRALNSVKKN